MAALWHVLLLAGVALGGFATYGVWFKDFLARNYSRYKETFPFSMVIGVMSLKAFNCMQRVVAVLALGFMGATYVWFLVSPERSGV